MANTLDGNDELKINAHETKPIGNKPQRHLRRAQAVVSETNEAIEPPAAVKDEPTNDTTETVEQKAEAEPVRLWWQNQ